MRLNLRRGNLLQSPYLVCITFRVDFQNDFFYHTMQKTEGIYGY